MAGTSGRVSLVGPASEILFLFNRSEDNKRR